MATQSGVCVTEGQSSTRPPLFNGTNYTYWKTRIRIYIQSIDYNIWKTIVKGPHVPTIMVNGVATPKLEEDWDEQDVKKIELNAKAMNLLYCAVDPNEFNRVSTCTSAKKIWDTLEVTHEGTNQVKQSKVNMLVHTYEMFKMESNEIISEMYTRFTNIINSLKSLGKFYSNQELVNKILRSLPSAWDAKSTAIQEAKDLDTLPLEQLVGSLMTYEMNIKQKNTENEKKKKVIALKTTTSKEESSGSSSEEEEDDDVALVSRKFRKFMRKKKHGYKKRHYKAEPSKEKEKEKEREKEMPICYECKKPGHFRADCPYIKKSSRRYKKKAMMGTWSESEDSSSEEE